MDRRTFLALASGAAAWPAPASAQGARKLPRIGIAAFPPLSALKPFIAAFEKGLREEGLIPGRDVVFDFRSANLDSARYGEVVRELVRSKPDVIVTGVNANTAAVKAETRTIPIVMTVGVDSVAMGFVESLARPGGNITGLTYDVGPESTSKRFELFKRAVPSITRVAVLSDGDTEGQSRYVDWIESAARSAGLEPLRRDLGDDFEESFLGAKRWRADA